MSTKSKIFTFPQGSQMDNFDPWPSVPVQFDLQARVTEDDRILVYMPPEFIGQKLILSGLPNKRYLNLATSGIGLEVKKGASSEGQTLPCGHLFFEASTISHPTRSRTRVSRRSHTRQGTGIYIGTLLDYLSEDFVSRNQLETPTPMPKKVMETLQPLERPQIIRPETDYIRDAIAVVNKAVTEKGLSLSVRDDGTLSASLNF